MDCVKINFNITQPKSGQFEYGQLKIELRQTCYGMTPETKQEHISKITRMILGNNVEMSLCGDLSGTECIYGVLDNVFYIKSNSHNSFFEHINLNVSFSEYIHSIHKFLNFMLDNLN